MEPKKLLMIVNPKAGRHKARGPLFDAAAVLSQGGYLLSIHNTTAQPGDAAAAAEAAGGVYDAVAAVGGDGTLNEVVNGLMRLEHPPLLGYLPRSSYTASQAAKNALGHFAYILEGIKDLNSLRPYRVRLTADGEVLDGEYLFGAVCNSTSIGGLMKLEEERVVLDDGKFELLLIPNPRTPADLQNLAVALLNQQYDSEGLVFRHAASIHLETEEKLPWSLDGEYAPSLPAVDIENRCRALEMLL